MTFIERLAPFKAHQEKLNTRSILKLTTTQNIEQRCLSSSQLMLDFSKQNIDCEQLEQLCELADNSGLADAIKAMFNGEQINHTEQRAVLHTVLRSPAQLQQNILGRVLSNQVTQAQSQLEHLVSSIHNGNLKSVTELPFTDVIVLGIGGSFYGAKTAIAALKPFAVTALNFHFVANIDPQAVGNKLAKLTPEQTLVVVISKTFTTQETLVNLEAIKLWQQQCNNRLDWRKHFFAVTSNTQLAIEHGIDEPHILPMWDWVGGRFSIWSCVGFPLALAVGIEQFNQFKQGAYALDQHFLTAPFAHNLPVVMALIGIWNIEVLGYQGLAVLPYSHGLRAFPGYLQQLDMESCGKSVNHQGHVIDYKTSALVFGQEGSNAQHAFMQLMHQGNYTAPVDFIVTAKAHDATQQTQHQLLLTNAIAQAEALLQGRDLTQIEQELAEQGLDTEQIKALAPHKVMQGNKPSSILIMEELTPFALGQLMALYEHKTMVQAHLWQINAFDQWGVELGKKIGTQVNQALAQPQADLTEFSLSTAQLIRRFNNQ